MDAALGILLRWALVADLMLVFGMPLFALYTVTGTGEPSVRSSRALICATALTGILLSMLGIVSLAGTMSGTPMAKVSAATLVILITQTAVGLAFLVRVGALAAAFALGLHRRNSRVVMASVAFCAAVALGSLAWSGHGVMDDGRTGVVHLVADIVHLLAAGVWVGALVSLLVLVRATGKAGADSNVVHGALAGFASFGSASVALVLITGLVNSWLLVGPGNVLTLGTALYGQLLLLKLALFAGMLWLAAINRLRLTPALGAALTPDAITAATRRLRLSLTLETVAAGLILGLVAWLGSLEPPAASRHAMSRVCPLRNGACDTATAGHP